MSLKINKEKCVKCLLCTTICPARIISEDEAGYTTVTPEMQDSCFKCGQCEAICPTTALEVDYPDAQPYTGDKLDTTISAEQLSYYMRSRRSVRHYKDTPVEKETIEKILDVVRYAPTGKNDQPVHWLVIHDTKELKNLGNIAVASMKQVLEQSEDPIAHAAFSQLVDTWENGYDAIFRGAPHLIIAHSRLEGVTPALDCNIALSHLELLAPAFGLGTCWAGFFMMLTSSFESVRKELNLPHGHITRGALMLGYPKYQYKNIPKRNGVKINWI